MTLGILMLQIHSFSLKFLWRYRFFCSWLLYLDWSVQPIGLMNYYISLLQSEVVIISLIQLQTNQ